MKKTVRPTRSRKPAKVVMATIDYKKSLPELYGGRREVTEVRVPSGTFLAVDGAGEPGGTGFQDAMHQLFTLAYTTKFAMKKAGGVDFKVPAVECLYLDDPCGKERSEWRWRLLVRVPPCVKAATLREVRKAIAAKNGPATDAVKRITWAEGKTLQLLHVGPYDQVGAAYGRLLDEAAARGLRCAGPAHEVYLNDPRRVAPAKLKTIIRMAVQKGT